MDDSKKRAARPVPKDNKNTQEEIGPSRYMSLGDLGTLIGKSYCDGCGFSGGQHLPDCPVITAPPPLEVPDDGASPPLESVAPSEPPFFPSDRAKTPESGEIGDLARALGRAVLRGAAAKLEALARKLGD